MIHGENVILYIDEDGTKPNRILAAAKSCELDVNQNFIQVCSPVSGRWDSFVPSTIGWTASVDMLVVSMANPQAWLNEMKQSATPLTMRYYDTELGIYQVGQCWIASWKNGATVGSISTFSLQLQGTGELRDADQESDYPILAGDTLYTKWDFAAADQSMNKQTGDIGFELDNDGNFVKHTN